MVVWQCSMDGVMLEWCGIPSMYVVGMYCDLVYVVVGCCCVAMCAGDDVIITL